MKQTKKTFYLKNYLYISVGMLCVIGILYVGYKNKSQNTIEHRLEWWLEAINWDENHQGKEVGKGIKIAVLDTGIDASHMDLEDNVMENIRVPLLGTGESNDMSHGTAIAGIVGAYPSHAKGVLGVAPGVTIVPIDITDEDTTNCEKIIEGIQIAIEKQVDIISISLGLKSDNESLHASIKEAYSKGIIIIGSAGNYMTDDILYPAKYDEVIAVGALSKKGEVISPKGTLSKSVVFLPGENIVTLSLEDDGYVGADGTSFSTAILSGIVAGILSEVPMATQGEIYAYFEENTREIDMIKCLRYFKGEK